MAKYFFFLDETGDHGLTYVDPNFPLFLLCGCLFKEDALEKTKAAMDDLKMKYFKTTEVILHSRDIRKCEGPFQILFDLKLKENFYKDLNQMMGDCPYVIISAAIHKEEHVKRYGKSSHDPYNTSFSFIMERLMFCTDSLDKNAEVTVMPEMRGRREDELFLSHYNAVMDAGTFYVDSLRFKNKIKHLKFCKKRDNIAGSQIADLSAYPLARFALNPKEPYIPFNVVKPKLYSDGKGNFLGYGLKVFP